MEYEVLLLSKVHMGHTSAIFEAASEEHARVLAKVWMQRNNIEDSFIVLPVENPTIS